MIEPNALPSFSRLKLDELEPNPLVVLAEPLELEYRDGRVVSYAGYGWTLDNRLINRLKNPEISVKVANTESEQNGADEEPSFGVLVFSDISQKHDILRNFAGDVKVAEVVSEEVRRNRELKKGVMANIDERARQLVRDFATEEKNLERIAQKRVVLGEYLNSPEMRRHIYEDYILPAIRSSAVGTYMLYDSNAVERGIDIATLATAIAVRTETPREEAGMVTLSGTLEGVPDTWLGSRFRIGSENYRKFEPIADLYITDKILRDETGDPIDGLRWETVEAVKHRATRRAGRRFNTRDEGDKDVEITYVGNGADSSISGCPDPLLREILKVRVWMREPSKKRRTVVEVATPLNEPLLLARNWINQISSSNSRFSILNAYKRLESERDLIARADYVNALLGIVREKYF